MKTNRPIRVVMAKPGLDGHDRGIKILARSFQEAGMEVIYLGLRQSPEMIINAAIEEDADVIAISILSGAHMTYFEKIKNLMDKNNMNFILSLLSDKNSEIANLFGVIDPRYIGTNRNGLPYASTYMINKKGEATYTNVSFNYKIRPSLHSILSSIYK